MLDKHKLLIPIIEFAAIEGIEVENESGETQRGFTFGTVQKPPYYVPIEHGWRIKNKGRVTLSVGFDKGTPTHGMDVSGMFSAFAVQVLNTVQLLESRLVPGKAQS